MYVDAVAKGMETRRLGDVQSAGCGDRSSLAESVLKMNGLSVAHLHIDMLAAVDQ